MLEPQRTAATRYPALDGVRGLAVLLVLATHISDRRNSFIGGFFAGDGEFGVWLFFVLSAFLLSLYFFQKPERMLRPIEWANYTVRRFTRIYPLYIIALLAGAAAGAWNLFNLGPAMRLQEPTYWAIYVEFRYYFLLPFIVAAFALCGRISRWLPPLLLVSAFAFYEWAFPIDVRVPGYSPWHHVPVLFPEYVIVFVTGTFAAWAYVHTAALRSRLLKSRTADAAIFVMLAVLLCASPQIIDRYYHADGLNYYHLEWARWGIFFAALIYLVMMTDGYASRFFASKPMRFFGFISYSMYLFMDFPIAALAQARGTSWGPLAFVLSFAIPIMIGWISFVLIERPLSRISLLKFSAAKSGVTASR